ncbi:nucleotidyltransferase family protein [Octadecabacter sp. CECT 8868]|uniref:nucleotidyltransferase family protein n=1 Tax=Octadecabacter algicola TaxID=2909342 RepID=UPI001F2C23F8|nr:nucleotidyltransferase family protein [Octadecabacter algicola]MCF2905101.1 nucleotidyltransferase family protein [Octadecabacter algicola]
MDSFGAIILAAGLSRRMGDRNKLLLPIHGKPMIRHVVETYLSVVGEQVWVVTGYENERIEAALHGLDVRIVHNENFEDGQPFSVRTGLLEARGADHYLIGLGDQPDLTGGDLRALIAAHLAGDLLKISIPYHGTTRGNPIIVPAAMQARLLADQANPGCGKFTRDHPELVQHYPMTQSGFFNDIDTPAAFDVFNQSTTLKDLT